MPKTQAITWQQFRTRYEQHISKLAQSTQNDWYRAADWYQRVGRPKSLEQAAERERIDKFADDMERKGLSPQTQKLYLIKLMAGISWAWRAGLLAEQPHYHNERLAGTKGPPPSRAVTELEFQKILETVPIVRPHDADLWLRLLKAASWCDLRMSELLKLSWEADAKIRMVRGPRGWPMILFSTRRAQKGWKPGMHPIHPTFFEIASKDASGAPLEAPEGHVFPMLGFETPHNQRSQASVYDVVSRIGELSGVITEECSGKHATCRDWGRKMYVTRLLSDPTLAIDDVRKMVRHESIQTTIGYYDSINHEKLGELLGWNDSK